jgi:hypothetical protein
MPCASKECTTRFQFIDGGLKYEEAVVQATPVETTAVVETQPQNEESAK